MGAVFVDSYGSREDVGYGVAYKKPTIVLALDVAKKVMINISRIIRQD